MRHFLILMFFIMCPILLIADNAYRVNTNSKLNVRSGPSTHYNITYQLKPGSIVSLVEECENGWAKIKYSSNVGFVQKKYIVQHTSSETNKSNLTANNWDLFDVDYFLYGILALIVIFIICLIFDVDFVMPLLIFLLPVFVILYVHLSHNPMWFCSPRSVGWILTCVNVFLTVIVLSICWSIFIESLKGVFSLSIMSLLMACLYGYTVYLIVSTAITELLIVGIILIIGSAKSSSYIGTFTDTSGRTWDVFRK